MRQLIADLDTRFEQTSTLVRYSVVVGLTAFICWLDFVTPTYLIITGLYFLPIFLAAWYCDRTILTIVFAAATVAKTTRPGIDFFPLTVDVEERMYAAGKIPGSFFRREGRPADTAILTTSLRERFS